MMIVVIIRSLTENVLFCLRQADIYERVNIHSDVLLAAKSVCLGLS